MMKVYENQIVFRLSKQVEELVDNVGENYTFFPKKIMEFKQIILNNSIILGERFCYFTFNPYDKEFIIMITGNGEPITYNLLANTFISITAIKYKSTDQYILYISIKPIQKTIIKVGTVLVELSDTFLSNNQMEYDRQTNEYKFTPKKDIKIISYCRDTDIEFSTRLEDYKNLKLLCDESTIAIKTSKFSTDIFLDYKGKYRLLLDLVEIKDKKYMITISEMGGNKND